LPVLVFCLARSRLPLYLLPSFLPLSILVARGMADLRWRRLGVFAIGAWVLLLLGIKFAATRYPSDKDARVFAARLERIIPGHPEHLMFIEDVTRNGLNLYFDSDVRRLSFLPQPKQISDSSYDQTVDEALAEPLRGRIFVFKRPNEAAFLAAAQRAGRVPQRLGVLPESHARLELVDGCKPVYRIRTKPNRLVYTLAGDFPVPGPVRRD
jgi:hypothetical protein